MDPKERQVLTRNDSSVKAPKNQLRKGLINFYFRFNDKEKNTDSGRSTSAGLVGRSQVQLVKRGEDKKK